MRSFKAGPGSKGRSHFDAKVAVKAVVVAGAVAGSVGLCAVVLNQAPPPRPQVSLQEQAAMLDAMNRKMNPSRVKLSVVGDSWVGGSDVGGRGRNNWSYLMAFDLNWIPASIAGIGGSGYQETGGHSTYATRAKRIPPLTDITIFCNGFNDLKREQVNEEAAAYRAFSAAKEAAPEGRVVVIGPAAVAAAGRIPNSPAWRMNEAVKAAAKRAGAYFIDPLGEDWFGGKNARYIGSDGFHPDEPGQKYYANKVRKSLKDFGLLEIESSSP